MMHSEDQAVNNNTIFGEPFVQSLQNRHFVPSSLEPLYVYIGFNVFLLIQSLFSLIVKHQQIKVTGLDSNIDWEIEILNLHFTWKHSNQLLIVLYTNMFSSCFVLPDKKHFSKYDKMWNCDLSMFWLVAIFRFGFMEKI